MTFTASDVFHLLLALLLLLAATRLGARLALRLRLPPVIGELTAGILLGPSVFGALFPEASAEVLPETGVVADALDAFYELGLILLMFAAGVELRAARAGAPGFARHRSGSSASGPRRQSRSPGTAPSGSRSAAGAWSRTGRPNAERTANTRPTGHAG
jgi:Sodium/hydrogen exchanger family